MMNENTERAPDIFDRIMGWRIFRPLQPFYRKYKEPLLYLFFGGLGEVGDRWPALDETEVVVHALVDARLLQDDLRKPYLIGRGPVSPRQVAVVFLVPINKGVLYEIHQKMDFCEGEILYL